MVRLLIFSDVHSNLEAFEAILHAAGSWDLAVNLGDTVGYGADPNAVIARASRLVALHVRGNHDCAVLQGGDAENFNPAAALAVEWTRNHLTAAHRKWLASVPAGPLEECRLAKTQFVHGSPLDEDEYLYGAAAIRQVLAGSSRELIFCGHTHLQGAAEYSDGSVRMLDPGYDHQPGKAERCDVPLEGGSRYLVNPGSVGQPRDGDWRAAFAIYDSGKRLLSFWRTPYNVERAQHKIIAAGLPFRLAARLGEGR
jgi:diadenosine tetraphosphatase ApaH/serine/threonine PP2A family protein phosphatase